MLIINLLHKRGFFCLQFSSKGNTNVNPTILSAWRPPSTTPQCFSMGLILMWVGCQMARTAWRPPVAKKGSGPFFQRPSCLTSLGQPHDGTQCRRRAPAVWEDSLQGYILKMGFKIYQSSMASIADLLLKMLAMWLWLVSVSLSHGVQFIKIPHENVWYSTAFDIYQIFPQFIRKW